MAAMLLLVVWVGPVTLGQTDSWKLLRLAGAPERAAAESRVIPAGEAMVLATKTPLKLRLHDGSVVEGRFVERTLLDSATYAPRFAANAGTSATVPIAMGETLHVSLRDGRELDAPFSGYAQLALLLRGPGGEQDLRVPFEAAREIRGASGERIDTGDLIWAFNSGLLPSAEALTLQRYESAGRMSEEPGGRVTVAVQDIESAAVEVASGVSPGVVVIIIVLTVVASVVLALVAVGSAFNDALDKCGSTTSSRAGLPDLSASPLTTRPFDRHRGCFVGDPLATAGPWPAPAAAGPPIALAAPAPQSPVAVKAAQ